MLLCNSQMAPDIIDFATLRGYILLTVIMNIDVKYSI